MLYVSPCLFLLPIIIRYCHDHHDNYHDCHDYHDYHGCYNFPLQLLAELDLLKGELDEDDDMHNIGECFFYTGMK